MIRTSLKTLRWCLSLGAKFARVVPFATASVVMITMVSQISMLLAMFLPLKVIILLGSDGMPRYFPPAFEQFDRDHLIIALSIATVVFFVTHLVAERIIKATSAYGGRQLLARSKKVTLFEGQDDLAMDSYQRYARALSGAVFFALVVTALMFVYPVMAGIILGYVALCILGIQTAWLASQRARVSIADKLSPLLALLSNTGFLLVFAWLLIDFMLLDPPGLLIAIISVLLTRQAFSRLANVAVETQNLSARRDRLDAIYFHGKHWTPKNQPLEATVWGLVDQRKPQPWVSEVFSQLDIVHTAPLETQFHTTGVTDVPALLVNDQADQRWLIKLFARNRNAQAANEAELLASPPAHLPAPTLLAATEANGFTCLILRPLPGAKTPPRAARKTARTLMLQAMLACEPTSAIIKRYRRSHPTLDVRFNYQLLEKLYLCANRQQRTRLQQLESRLTEIQNCLADLPLTFVNSGKHSGLLWLDTSSNEIEHLHWGRWSIEPIGFQWKLAKRQFNEHLDAAEAASTRRPALADLNPRHCRISALASSIEAAAKRQDYQECFLNVDKLLGTLERQDKRNAKPKKAS